MSIRWQSDPAACSAAYARYPHALTHPSSSPDGAVRIHKLGADGLTPIEESCTRNGGSPCDNTKLDHAG